METKVKYSLVDGAHFFVSGDEMSLGLCAAHKDFTVAFGDVSCQLKNLYCRNHNTDLSFRPKDPPSQIKAAGGGIWVGETPHKAE